MKYTESNQHPTAPFREIINLQLEKVYQQTESTLAKEIPLTKTLSSYDIDRKEVATEEGKSSELEGQKTMKIQPNSCKAQFLSTKTINENGQSVQPQNCQDLDFQLFSNMSVGETAHILRLEKNFKSITQPFLNLCKSLKLGMCQHTDSFITVKKGNHNNCRCVFKIWGASEPDTTVYQLRRYGRGKQAKLIMVEGDEMAFHNFYLALLRTLEVKKLVKVSPGARVQLLFDEESAETYECTKICSKMHKMLSKGKKIDNDAVNDLVSRLKNQSSRLKNLVYKREDLLDLNTLEQQMEALCYQTSDIISLFGKIYQGEYQVYRQKRQRLLKRFPISDLFRQLQISEHYNQFRRLRSLKQIEDEEKIPYMSATRELKKLATVTSASAAYEHILIFRQQIRIAYNCYFKNCLRLGDMDDYLPVTIFCVLAVDSEENILGLIKLLMSQLKDSDDNEWEKKTLTDLEAAFEYILQQWKIPK